VAEDLVPFYLRNIVLYDFLQFVFIVETVRVAACDREFTC
jgi:hypothetical protein